MFGFKKRGEPEVQPAPAAPATVAIASIDAQLRAVSGVPAPARTVEQWAYIDRLLDARMGAQRVQPAVPVIPGRGGEGGAR